MSDPIVVPTRLPPGVMSTTAVRHNQRTQDVIVFGGGPAGAAAALSLARAGRTVLILERSWYERPRIGEILPPEIRLPLTELGIWERFLAVGPLPSPGIAASWGGEELYGDDSLFNPYGEGWHVDRTRFDEMLAAAASRAGAEVLLGVERIECERGRSGWWHVSSHVMGKLIRFRVRSLIDATGRACSPIRRFGGRRIIYDRLVALIGIVPTTLERTKGSDQRAIVEAVPDGWWYSAPLPMGRLVASFFTDADLLPRKSTLRLLHWIDRLKAASHTHSRLGQAFSQPMIHVKAASTSRLRVIAGDGHIAVGDAAVTLDPLSGQGVYRALQSGQTAAWAIDEHLRGDCLALADYAQQVEADFTADLVSWAAHYAHERRWPESPFWKQRRALAGQPRI